MFGCTRDADLADGGLARPRKQRPKHNSQGPMVAFVNRTKNICDARAFGGRFCNVGGTPKHAMRVRLTLERKLVCARRQIRSVTTTVFHVFGRTPKSSHNRRGNPSGSDLHAFARCSLPRDCVDAVTAVQAFSVKKPSDLRTKCCNELLNGVLVLGTKSGVSFGDMNVATPAHNITFQI